MRIGWLAVSVFFLLVSDASALSGAVVPITVAEGQLRGLPAAHPGRFAAATSPIAQVGDVNGDGLADVAVAAPSDDARGRRDAGAVYVLFGGAPLGRVDVSKAPGFRIDGPKQGTRRPLPVFQPDGPPEGAMAGSAVSGAGDVNGDGLADLVVGAPFAGRRERSFSGSAYVVFGKASTTNIDLAALGTGGDRIDGAGGGTPPNPPTDSGTLGDQAGYSVAGAGDLTGDGRADVLVAAPGADNNGRSDSGSAYLVSFAAPTLKEVRRQIRDLIAVVRFFGLQPNERIALNVRLRIALAALRGGSRTTACSALNGFIVRAFIDTRGILTRAQATFLITDAIRIRADLGCS